ncbi:MAG: aminoglycoside phosphotransferase family protein [Actinobacteria bacterium]|nr:aminoglycoside phosphotransferase family protein [Actinomycetota bacterium]
MAPRSHLFAALRHPTEPRIVLLRSDREWRLPHVRASEVRVADASAIVDVFERRLGTRAWLLRQIRFGEEEARSRVEGVFELELVDPGWTLPAHARWVGRPELDRLRLKDEEHRALLDEYLGALQRDEFPAERPPWARPGWREHVETWLETEVARLGHRIIRLHQIKQWSISSVLRIETDGPCLYLKSPARLPLFVEEATVTATLAELFPGYVPTPLAIEAREGWLLLPELREVMGWGAPLETRADMLRRFAGLQRRTAARTAELLAAGCLDRRLDVLETQIDPLLDDPEAVARVTPDDVADLRSRADDLKEACRQLAAVGLPDTLVHGDLHLGNVAREGGELVYFDWTDACIGHPFIDLLALQWERDEADRAALLEAYLDEWDGVTAPERLRVAAKLAGVVIPLHHAVSYWQIVASLEPAAKWELDATHTFLREALARVREL